MSADPPRRPTANDLPLVPAHVLARRNGQDRREIWIAFRGLIYDVTSSRLWLRGRHYEHWAGQDLTDELADAPHADEVFAHFEVIGRLSP